jgi:hypothetical protein
VIAASDDLYVLFLTSAASAVDNPVVSSDPPRPPAGEIAAQRLGLANPF